MTLFVRLTIASTTPHVRQSPWSLPVHTVGQEMDCRTFLATLPSPTQLLMLLGQWGLPYVTQKPAVSRRSTSTHDS